MTLIRNKKSEQAGAVDRQSAGAPWRQLIRIVSRRKKRVAD